MRKAIWAVLKVILAALMMNKYTGFVHTNPNTWYLSPSGTPEEMFR
ncbi:hypothetical protein TNCV_2136361, partial [Trichonephila clavipes]